MRIIAITTLALFASLAFTITDVRAQIGEDLVKLRARFGTSAFDASNGSPIDLSAIPPSGLVAWKTPEGKFLVLASFIVGKAAYLFYNDVTETACAALKKQMLPVGNAWTDGNDVRAFLEKAAKESSLSFTFDLTGFQYWQTSDGELWAVWSARAPANAFFIGTPDGFRNVLSLALTLGLLPS